MAKPWAKAFYNSAAWQHTRLAYMTHRHGLCERCGAPGLIVHHRKALRPQEMDNPTSTQQLEYYGALAEAGGAADMIGVCTSLIYDSCPTLQDPELHKTLGVVDPYDAVRQLMSVREIDRLGGELFQWNGLMPGKPDGGQAAEDTAKNS